MTLVGTVSADTTAPIRATCLRCRAIVRCALPLSDRDIEALAAHLRTCEGVAQTERPPDQATIGDILWYFAIEITLG